tara:strand:+ start:418 stop:666 length:249 start_codon:yes stop_codon:yes gene_type:complete
MKNENVVGDVRNKLILVENRILELESALIECKKLYSINLDKIKISADILHSDSFLLVHYVNRLDKLILSSQECKIRKKINYI